jgi:NADPH2:quinone reductase
MQALLVDHFGGAEVIKVGELPLPEPAQDEILIRVLAAGIGPWDVEQRRGGWKGSLPYVPGAQFAGVVVGDTGDDAAFEDGEEVYGWAGPGGCLAEYVACQAERLAPIPDGLAMTDAAAVPVDALTAEEGITGILSVGAGDQVLITAAAGGLGQFAVQLGRALGANVIATANRRDHELVHKLGAAVVIDQTSLDWPDQVREVTDGGPHRVLACTASSVSGAARAARDGATIAAPFHGEFPDAHRINWRPYDGRPSGSGLIRMAPWFDDGSLSVDVAGMYYWLEAAKAYRAVEQADTPGEVVLVVDVDLAASLEV